MLLVVALMSVPGVGFAQNDTSETTTESSPSASAEGADTPALSKTGTTLWLFRSGNLTAGTVQAFRAGLREALQGSERRHLLSRDDFEDHLKRQTGAVPDCMKGLEPCVSPEATAFEAAGLESVVRLRLQGSPEGQNGRLTARYKLVDARGRVIRESTIRAADARKLAFNTIREIFDATGAVSIRTTPPGARVHIDGRTVGTTPLDTRLAIGTHSYRLTLDDYQPVEDAFEVTSSKSELVRHKLQPKPGQLVIEGAPEGAEVLVDGKKVGRVPDPVELAPGEHTVTVRADGYESMETTVEVAAGQTVRQSAPLERKNALLQSVDVDEIANNNYVIRLSYDQNIHGTTFRDARGFIDEREFEFLGFVDEDDMLTDELVKRTVAPPGVRLDFSYTGRHFGVVVMSLSYNGVSLDQEAMLDPSPTDSGDEQLATITALHRLQLRPFQITGRFFYENFAPMAELGTGISFQWVDATIQQSNEKLTLSQTEPYWTLGLGGQYFFTSNWFAMLRYSFQDYFNAGKGVEHVISLGIGGAFPNVFGFEPEPPEEL